MHEFRIRVYFEDTDLAGIVYYANYLKFIERARSEFLRSIGVDQKAIAERTGGVFAVTGIEAKFLRPAHYDDLLTVSTLMQRVSGARIVLAQDVGRNDENLFASTVSLAFVGTNGRPKRLPFEIAEAFAAYSMNRDFGVEDKKM